MTRSIAAVVSALALGACAHHQVLEPAPGAPLAAGQRDVAQATTSGVTVMVTGDSWNGDPSNLGRLFTPVRVSIDNKSGKTLRVSYRDFSLTGSSGFHYAAVPPLKAQGTLSSSERPPSPSLRQAGWEHDRFFVARHYAYFYPGLDAWPGPFGYDPLDYSGARWPERLPTQDMLSEALPEGVIENGGKAAGYVYFQAVTNRESAVQFQMALTDASSEQTFGQISLPFQSTQQ